MEAKIRLKYYERLEAERKAYYGGYDIESSDSSLDVGPTDVKN